MLEARSENGCGKSGLFWSEIGSGIGEAGGTSLPRLNSEENLTWGSKSLPFFTLVCTTMYLRNEFPCD